MIVGIGPSVGVGFRGAGVFVMERLFIPSAIRAIVPILAIFELVDTIIPSSYVAPIFANWTSLLTMDMDIPLIITGCQTMQVLVRDTSAHSLYLGIKDEELIQHILRFWVSWLFKISLS